MINIIITETKTKPIIEVLSVTNNSYEENEECKKELQYILDKQNFDSFLEAGEFVKSWLQAESKMTEPGHIFRYRIKCVTLFGDLCRELSGVAIRQK